MLQCPHCGMQQDDSAFCRGCGAPLSNTGSNSSGFFNSLGGLDDLSAPAPAPQRQAPPVAPPPAPTPRYEAPPVPPPAPRYEAPRPTTPPPAPRPTTPPPAPRPATPPPAPQPTTPPPAKPSAPPPASATTPVKPMRRISAAKELRLLLRQGLLILFGDRKNLIISLLFPLLAGGVTVWIAGENMFLNHEATKASCFILVCAAIWCGLFNSIQTLVKERPNIKRDYVSGALRIECYMGSRSIIQIVLCAIQSFVLTLSICAIDWVWGNPLPQSGLIFSSVLVEYYVSLFLVMLASDAMGLMISAMVKKEELASKLAPYILIAQLLFSGMLFEMRGIAYTLSAIMISRWGMEALGSISTLYERNTVVYINAGGEQITQNPCICPPVHVQSCKNFGSPVPLQPCECPVQHGCAQNLLKQLQYNTPASGDPQPFEATNDHLLLVWLIMGAFVIVSLVAADLLLHRVKKDGRG